MSTGVADILPYRPRRSRADSTAWLGMLLFLVSWTMLFAALFAAYGVLRVRAPAWPPPDVPRLPLLLPGANTLAILAGSFALQSALHFARTGRVARVLPAALAALVLGALFLAGQSALWAGLWREGLRPEGGPFPSVFYGLTAFHALHVLVGLFGLGFVAVRASRASYGPTRHLGLRLWCGYWHFVGAIWLLLYVTIFVL
jgi:cytochrome c oxidase subunit III